MRSYIFICGINNNDWLVRYNRLNCINADFLKCASAFKTNGFSTYYVYYDLASSKLLRICKKKDAFFIININRNNFNAISTFINTLGIVNENILLLSINKNEIWERIHGITTNYTPFGYTFGKLQSFRRYIYYVKNNLVVSGKQISSQDYDKVYPLKMWDVDYKDNQYTYTSLSGENIAMNKYESELWELANGNNSLDNIQRLISKKHSVSSFEIKEFYDKLEDRLGIVYKKYDLKQ